MTNPVAFRLPAVLVNPDDDEALRVIGGYFGNRDGTGTPAVGATFDGWDSTGSRAQDNGRFTADDLIAIGFLSVRVPAPTARILLRDRADELADLLAEVGPDRDLVDEDSPIGDDWPACRLYRTLVGVSGIKRTIASKLLARKRPRLLPVWDRYVGQVTGCTVEYWEPLRQALRADGRALYRRLLRLHDVAELPGEVSPLRVVDVICWREGKGGV